MKAIVTLNDDRKVCFDCIKTTITKFSTELNIPDSLKNHPEITGAVRAGFIKLADAEQIPEIKEPSTKYKNIKGGYLSFDSLKINVPANGYFDVPNSKTSENEIETALMRGWIKQLTVASPAIDTTTKEVVEKAVEPVTKVENFMIELTKKDLICWASNFNCSGKEIKNGS